jgi:predicted enzyme related to lactoylglutathione lyase
MAVTGIAFTMYPVADVPRAVAFYSNVLGLKKAGLDLEYWVEFEIGGSTFGLGSFEQVGKPGTAQSISLEVDDMAAFRKMLADRSVESTEPFETPVCWISAVKDPDGNTVYLHQTKAQ